MANWLAGSAISSTSRSTVPSRRGKRTTPHEFDTIEEERQEALGRAAAGRAASGIAIGL
jgi:hypothetical protein